MPKFARVTLSDIARAAGLSTGGTSYALRGHPSIPAPTIERVRRLATEMGYRPDSRISSLMATIRRGGSLGGPESLALVWINTPRLADKLPAHLQHYMRVTREGARQRAEQLGWGLKEFWLGDGEMRPSRLNQILRTRGISGAVFSPAASDHGVAIDMDWSGLAGAIVGNTDCTPVLHRAAHYHYRSVWLTLERLRQEGFARPAVVLSRSVQDRIHSMQLAAFLTNHPAPRSAPELVQYSLPEKPGEIRSWPRAMAPDALIMAWQLDARAARAVREIVPTARRVVTLEWHPHGVLPGVDPCNETIAANAVDIVIAQLHRNEFGVPTRPTTLMLDGIWRETW